MKKFFHLLTYLWSWQSLLAIVLVAGGFAYYFHEKNRIRADQYTHLAIISGFKVSQIQHWRQERISHTKVTAGNPMFRREISEWIRNPGAPGLRKDIENCLKLVQKNYAYESVFMCDRAGRVLLTSIPEPKALLPPEKHALKKVIAGREAVFCDLRPTQEGKVIVDTMGPVFGPDGHLLAIVVMRSNAERFLYPLLRFWPTSSPSAETILVRRDGQDVLFLHDLRFQPNTAVSLRYPLSWTDVSAVLAVQGNQGQFEAKDYRGVEVLCDMHPITGSPWFMINKVDSDEVLAEARHRSWVVSIFLTLFAFLAITSTAYKFRKRQAKIYKDLYRVEQEHRIALETFKATLYSIGDGVITTDTKGKVRQMNQVAEKLTGWPEAEALGSPIDEVFHIINEETRVPEQNPLHRVLCKGTTVSLANHTLLIARNGSARSIAESAAPISEEEGAMSGAVIVFRDQTEVRVAEKALKENEERLKLVLEGSQQAFWDYNIETGEVRRSERYAQMLGYKPHEIDSSSKKWLDRIHPEDRKAVWQSVQDHLEGKTAAFEKEIRMQTKNGRYKWILARGKVVSVDPSGHPYRMSGTDTDIDKLKRAETALQIEHDKAQMYLNTAEVIFLALNKQGEIELINPKGCRILGYEVEELLGKNWFEICLPERIRKKVFSVFNRLMAGEIESIEYFENEVVTRSGAVRIIRWHNTFLKDDRGRTIGTFGSGEDVTERKQAEEERDRMFNMSIDMLCVAGFDGYFKQLNPAWTKTLGWSEEELKAKPWIEFVHPNDRLVTIEDARSLSAGGIDDNFENRYLAKDGSYRWISWHSIPLIEEKLFFCVARDVTERKQALDVLQKAHDVLEQKVKERTAELTRSNEALQREINRRRDAQMHMKKAIQELQHSQAMLRSVFDGISDPLILVDRNMSEKMWNRAAERYYEPAGEIIQGKPCHKIFDSKAQFCQTCKICEAVSKGESLNFERKGFIDEERIEKVFAYPVEELGRNTGDVIIRISDITESVKLQAELLQADKLISLGTLVAGMAHEINNPNNFIMINAPIVSKAWEDILPILKKYHKTIGDFKMAGLPFSEMEKEIPGLISGIENGARRIRQIVQELREYSAKGEILHLKPQDINQALEKAVSLLHHRIKECTVAFRVEYGKNLPPVKCDLQKLEQVFVNLINNALESLPDVSKSVHLKTYFRQKQQLAIFEICDEGIGIPEKEIKRIMDPFYTTKRDYMGIGLGLAISLNLVKQHGGTIEVESKESKGSTFRVTLPSANKLKI